MCVSDDQTQEDMSVNIHKSKKFHFQGTSFKALDVTGTGQTTTELTRDASPGDLSISPIDTNGEGDELSEFLPKNIHQKALDELFVLCKNGASATLKFLIHYNTELDYLINEKRRCNVSDIYLDISALQFCAACGNDEVLSVLLECPSINCNIKDSTNQVTALHLAVLMGMIFIKKSLFISKYYYILKTLIYSFSTPPVIPRRPPPCGRDPLQRHPCQH